MTAAASPLHILSERPLRADGTLIVFAAQDGDGPLELCLTPARWEQLQAEAPLPADAEDRRDYALGRIEALAAPAPRIDSAGGRTVFLE